LILDENRTLAFQAKKITLSLARKSFVNGWERNALPIEPTLIDDREIHPVAAKLQAMFWTSMFWTSKRWFALNSTLRCQGRVQRRFSLERQFVKVLHHESIFNSGQ
jgi:hypothetical protein